MGQTLGLALQTETLLCSNGRNGTADHRYNFPFPSTVSPNPHEFNLTAIGGARDRRVGTLVVRDSGSEVTVSVMMEADPCPSVQWSHEGSTISSGDAYTVTDPCAGTPSPFTYSLTVGNLTSVTSGAYSALFTNLAGSAPLPRLYVTVPGGVYECDILHYNYVTLNPPPVSIQSRSSDIPVASVSLVVSGDPVAQCLLNASEVTITCNTDGFPRPAVLFRRDGIDVTPGMGPFSHYRELFTDQVMCDSVCVF